MKISICIPQYNRIEFLLSSLKKIEAQDYDDIEIVISDDCSSDNTVEEIRKLKEHYKYPIVFSRNEVNLGYDRNLRKSMELASGDYLFVIGNDDSLFFNEAISFLADFLKSNNYPDVGFCNFVEFKDQEQVINRAIRTAVLGSGNEVAFRNYSNFTFVGGLIYKRTAFESYNTNRYDGSIYVQIYLALRIIIGGGQLFSIKEPLVLKDLWLNGKFRHSYRDRLPKKWKDYKKVDGGLISYGNVIESAYHDAGVKNDYLYRYLKRMYLFTFPHWVLDYKYNGSWIGAAGLAAGLNPSNNKLLKKLSFTKQLYISMIYYFTATLAFISPSFVFMRLKNRLYNFKKKAI